MTVQLDIPAIKIKNIKAEIRDLRFEIIPNKVIVQGVIHKQVFFVGTDNIVRHQSDDMPFSTFIDVFGAMPGMLAQIQIDIEKVIARLSEDGTAIFQEVILDIFVKVEEERLVEVVVDPTGPLVELNQFIVSGDKQIITENTITLSQPALKIEEIRGEIIDLSAEIITDKVLINGTIHKQIFFINMDNSALHQSEDVFFELSIDLPGAQPGMDIFVDGEVENISYNLSEDGLVLSQQIISSFEARITQSVQRQIATGFDLLTKLPQVIGENTKQVMQENQLILENPAIKIKEIVAEIRNGRTEIFDNKVIVQGTLHKQIFAIGPDNVEFQQVEDIPFSTFLDIPGATAGQFARVEFTIEEILFELINENLLDQKAVIEVFVKIEEEIQLNVLTTEEGLLVVLPIVVGENDKQIIVEQEVPPPVPPIGPVVIEFETIVRREEVEACQQAIVTEIVELECPAIKVKSIEATVEDVDINVELVTATLILVTGLITKDIAFVCEDNIVRHKEEVIPFAIEINLPQPVEGDDFEVTVEVEKVSFQLLDGGERVKQLIVLKACVSITGVPSFIRVVTLITGPGITTETILVTEQVVVTFDPLVTEVRTFPVVTDVSDPLGVLSVVEKAILVLNVVGIGLTPVEVVVFAE